MYIVAIYFSGLSRILILHDMINDDLSQEYLCAIEDALQNLANTNQMVYQYVKLSQEFDINHIKQYYNSEQFHVSIIYLV